MSQKTHSSRITAFKNASKGAQELRRKRAEASVALRRAARDDQLQKRRALSPPAGGLDANEDASGTPEKLPAPAEIVAGLQSTDAATLIVAARAARRTLSREQNPPIALMVAAGCVAPLVAALDRDDCPELQFEAAWALTNIASGTHEDTMSVIDAHAIPKLVRLLPYGGQLGEQAAWAVGNIAGDGAEARDAALAAGALGALLPVLGSESSGTSNSALRTGVWTLSNLCRNKNPLVSFEKVAPALPYLADLLLSADQDVLADACWALSYLTDGPNSRIESVQQTRGLLANLVPLLSHDAPAVRTPALRAVGNMVTGTDQQTDRVLDTSALQHINALLRCSKASLVKEAAWAISNVMAGSQPQIQRCIDAGVLPHLVYVIREGEPRCQKEAAWAITNMSLGGNVVQLGALLAEGFLGPYCALLASPDPRTLTVVLEGITNLLQAAEKYGETESLCLRLEEEGALDKLESLQQHENEQIYQKTLHILDTYFSDGTVEDQQAPTSNGEEFAFGTTNQEVGKF